MFTEQRFVLRSYTAFFSAADGDGVYPDGAN